MSAESKRDSVPALSVVIPSYNSASFLPSTIDALAIAIQEADLQTEVIVVDDGSTDETPDVIKSVAGAFPGVIRAVRQENRGRFLARWEGIQRARADLVLLLDSRVLIAPGALKYVFAKIADDPSRVAWNGHVPTDSSSPLVGLFWDVPTYVFWGGYLRSPRPFDLTPLTFDSAPKGTTMFLASRDVLLDAFEFAWPSTDSKLVSDDTKLLRRIAEAHTIRLDPGFAASYRPRTTVGAFIKHTFDRGTLFVDSYAGTSALRSGLIVGLACAPVVFVAAALGLVAAGHGIAAVALVALVIVGALAPAVLAVLNRCPPRSVIAYVSCLPLFVVPFWLGLVRGLFVHRTAFRHTDDQANESEGKYSS